MLQLLWLCQSIEEAANYLDCFDSKIILAEIQIVQWALLVLGQILNNPLNDTVIESAVFESDIPDRLIMVPVNFVRDDASNYLVSCNLISHFDILKADILPILRS